MGLESTVREQDNGIARCERQELVGERRAGVHERGARLPDPLGEELSVGGEVRGRSDASPDDAVGGRKDRDGRLEGRRRDVSGKGLYRREVIADRGAEELAARGLFERAPQTFADWRVVSVRRERPAHLGQAAVPQ